MSVVLEPWSFQIKSDFSLRGWRTRFSGKPVIVFLHGNGFSSLTYKPMLDILSQDFDLIVPDLPGHGDSGYGEGFDVWNDAAKFMSSVLNNLSHQIQATTPIFGLGHSYGGVITGLMAGNDEKRFKKIMLLDPVIFSKGMLSVMTAGDLFGLLERTPLAKQARARTTQWSSKQEAFDYFHERGTFKGWREDALQAYVDHALVSNDEGVQLKCPTSIESKIFASYPKKLWSSLSKVSSPCKILVAEKSFPFIARSVEKLSRLRPYSSERIEGGHCFMQENPEVAAEHVKQWFLESRIF
ncbi:alpha/beta fold hydrolase [Bermanella sp. R86510]|uniref:alpha/beta fold hydrolase n=1 Tax=unclassified Bermanella TaxID=2627862 RepID=UPI0037C793E1